MGPVFVLGAVQIAIFGRSAAVGAGFGVTALGTGIAAEGVIAPSGIPVAFQLLSASVTGSVVAVHIAIFIGIHRPRAAVFTVTTGSTFSV